MCVSCTTKSQHPLRVAGGNSWADAVYSIHAPVEEYIRYKCKQLERNMAKENLVVETRIMPFRQFSISIGGRLAFKGTFQFVERCRAVSCNAFIVQMEKYIHKAANLPLV